MEAYERNREHESYELKWAGDSDAEDYKRKLLRIEGKASLSVALRASASEIFKLRRIQMISSESTRAIRLSGLDRMMLYHTGNIWQSSAGRALHSNARKELFIEPSLEREDT